MFRIISPVAIALAAVLGATRGAVAQPPKPPSPKDFVMAASQTDHYEIEAARVAEVESQDPRVREFAQEMIRDHTHANDALRQAAKTSGLPAPEPGMSSDQAMFLSTLQSLRGAEFDKAYVRQQVLAHTQAVAVSETFAAKGSDENLRNAASSGLPTIRRHLKLAQELQADIDRGGNRHVTGRDAANRPVRR